MPSMFELRNMWRDALTRKGLTVNDLDTATKALIADYESKETAYAAKVTDYETAKTSAERLSRELMTERSDMMMNDSKINFAIMSVKDVAPAPAPPIVP